MIRLELTSYLIDSWPALNAVSTTVLLTKIWCVSIWFTWSSISLKCTVFLSPLTKEMIFHWKMEHDLIGDREASMWNDFLTPFEQGKEVILKKKGTRLLIGYREANILNGHVGVFFFFLKYLSCICATLKCPPKDICIFSWYGSLKTAERRFNTRVPFQISESVASIESTSSSVAKTA